LKNDEIVITTLYIQFKKLFALSFSNINNNTYIYVK
jgi:hypothetical protein